MWDKQTLSPVSEYKPSVKLARGVAAEPPSTEAVPGSAKPSSADATGLLDPKILQNALNNLSSHVQNLHRSLHFSVDQESGDTVVRIVDSDTKEVIRQIPSEELLAIAHRLKSSSGVLLTEQV